MTTPRRRRLLSVAGFFSLLAAILVIASPTSAASHSGKIVIKGPGSLYSGPNGYVSEAVGAGSTDTFELEVFNTGTTLAQYNIKVASFGFAANVNLYAGTLALTPLAASPDGYYTAAIEPGKYQALTLKVAVPSGTPQSSITTELDLRATDGTYLNAAFAQTNVKAPTYGTTAADVFARQGSQPWIGGSVNSQSTTAPAIKVGATATFKVKLQNDGSVPAAVRGYLGSYNPCTTIVVKDGTTDVTAALRDDTYITPVLAVHAAKTLTVTFTRTGSACAAYDYAYFYAHDPSGYAVYHYALTIAPFPTT